MTTMNEIVKRVENTKYYDMEDFQRDVQCYIEALSQHRLIFVQVKRLKNHHVYRVRRITEDGFSYSLHLVFLILGYRVNDKFEVYLPYNFRDVVAVQSKRILDTLLSNGFITAEQYDELTQKRAVEI